MARRFESLDPTSLHSSRLVVRHLETNVSLSTGLSLQDVPRLDGFYMTQELSHDLLFI